MRKTDHHSDRYSLDLSESAWAASQEKLKEESAGPALDLSCSQLGMQPAPPWDHGHRPRIRSLAFDLMGTCVDWHTSVSDALSRLAILDASQLATDWRAGFFRHILDSFEKGEQSPDIDTVHRMVLDRLLSERGVLLSEKEREDAVRAWHRQLAWPDAIAGLERLKAAYDVVVLANGTTRLQLDIVSSSKLPFHALFSSQLLQATKPDPSMYTKCLELLGREPGEVAMVAAHAYDLKAAKKVGMRTIYIRRETEDPDEDMGQVREEVDLFVGGLEELAEALHVDVE